MNAEVETLSVRILYHGKIHTPWSGAVQMADGLNYYGNVYKLNDEYFVFYNNLPVEVRWNTDHYERV